MWLAAIADDFTGGSDLAGMLFERGVRTVQTFGLPDPGLVAGLGEGVDACVVSLKTRSIPRESAVAQILHAHRLLSPLRPREWYFKYCSTFDSTHAGNIGPVAEALLESLHTPFTIAVPALPVNGRTQYRGHLFVNGQLLSESPMRTHPLNPMTDSNLVRFLQSQCTRGVGLARLEDVRRGPLQLSERLRAMSNEGIGIALVDAIEDSDLAIIAAACEGFPLLTGGSGLGAARADLWRSRQMPSTAPPQCLSPLEGCRGILVISGSCSAMTLDQLETLQHSGIDIIRVDARAALLDDTLETQRLCSLALQQVENGGIAVVASSAPARERMTAIDDLLPAAIERVHAGVASHLCDRGKVGGIIVAGGETSGAVVRALGVKLAEVTAVLAPGVPALRCAEPVPLRLILKSGNFGGPGFFLNAIRYLEAH